MKVCFFICMVCTLFLTGCWDEKQFKNVKLVLSLGFDQGEEGEIIQTVSIPTVNRASEGPGSESLQIVSTSANTPLHARDKIDQMISETYDPSKVKVVLLGEDLAKKNIYPILDDMYRSPRSNLNAYLAVVEEGTAKEVISMNHSGATRISNYIGGLLEAAVSSTHATGENLQLLCAELLEPGIDFSVPLLKIEDDGSLLTFNGMGLFHEKAYTGEKIGAEQTTMYMLLQGVKGRVARLTEKIDDNGKDEILDYVTVSVAENDRKMKVENKDGEIAATIHLDMSVKIAEYPSDHLYVKGRIEEISKKLSERLTEESVDIIAQLQEANSDVFGIGRRVKAYHPEVWKEIDWSETYPEISITPTVEVEIIQHGIIN
ncbi:Ger(x)C family spore germination protein [Halobacillus sp. Nhm2S1]|uniref:Ger(x)C family spore germination protein n=1 Tax=Halobacillus sp. Nhm2S1 TaxID=2866716 RepID=UPI001C72FFCC|nr:Ger(x)C family spore germination protein [Halobacillus sp. Nhm2S1]MBX0357295.1 Ger(x)C family spore germination protein [Halobacillus sp. Nhm2S1]